MGRYYHCAHHRALALVAIAHLFVAQLRYGFYKSVEDGRMPGDPNVSHDALLLSTSSHFSYSQSVYLLSACTAVLLYTHTYRSTHLLSVCLLHQCHLRALAAQRRSTISWLLTRRTGSTPTPPTPAPIKMKSRGSALHPSSMFSSQIRSAAADIQNPCSHSS